MQDKMSRLFPETVYGFYTALGQSGVVQNIEDVDLNNPKKMSLGSALQVFAHGGWTLAAFMW